MAITKTKIFVTQFGSLTCGLLAAWWLYHRGAPEPAALIFCLASLFAWIVSSDRTKIFISVLGLLIIVLCAIAIVAKGQTDVNSWFAVKIVFVVYFGIFVGHLVGAWSKGNEYIYNGILAFLLAVCVVIKYSTQADVMPLFEPIARNMAGTGIYVLSDLFEDIAFGLAGALAAEILKAAQITPSTGP
jgi:hypothetical protein